MGLETAHMRNRTYVYAFAHSVLWFAFLDRPVAMTLWAKNGRKWQPQCTYRLIAVVFELEQGLFQWRSPYSKHGQQVWVSEVCLVYATVPQSPRSKNGWLLSLFTACSLTEDSASSVKAVTNKTEHPEMAARAKPLHQHTEINSFQQFLISHFLLLGLCGTVA